MLEKLKNPRRIVIKVGSSILTTDEGQFSSRSMERIGEEVLRLRREGKEVVLVSSGAIALGMQVQGLKMRPREMSRLQACAAIGQGKLMHAYEQFFSKHGLHTAQILLTRDGLEDRGRFLKARRTLEELLKMKVLPIVNENDTVATDEIGFGDNDVLSAQLAHLIHSDLLVILSDVDGFFLKDGTRVREVAAIEEIDNQLTRHLRDAAKQKTVGGMKAKLNAARFSMRLGVPLLMINGHEDGALRRFLEGEDLGTVFHPGAQSKSARKKWIAFSAARKGAIVTDDGAYRALQQGSRSLLARGILKTRGAFSRGDVVELETEGGQIFGRGVARYSDKEISKIAGKKSTEIQAILGYKHQDEVIHCNDLVIWR